MRTFAWAVVAVLSSWTAQAAADCGVPKLELLWSYPANSDTNVPRNAELWVLVPWGHGQPVVQLNGLPLSVSATPDDAPGVIHALPACSNRITTTC